MTNATLKTTLAAAAISLSFLAAPAAHAGSPNTAPNVSRNTGVGHNIAEQGNAALRAIRAEVKAALKFVKPMLPRATKVSLPSTPAAAGAGASFAATARCAE